MRPTYRVSLGFSHLPDPKQWNPNVTFHSVRNCSQINPREPGHQSLKLTQAIQTIIRHSQPIQQSDNQPQEASHVLPMQTWGPSVRTAQNMYDIPFRTCNKGAFHSCNTAAEKMACSCLPQRLEKKRLQLAQLLTSDPLLVGYLADTGC